MLARVVVDTNIFLGACLGIGPSLGVIEACLNGRCIPLMGSALFAEYEDVMGRRELFQKSRLTRSEREELLDIFAACCEWTRVYFGWRPNLPDEGDNHLIELAVAGGAAFVVTRNMRDLKRSELKFPELRILDPAQFMKEVNS
jgi:putative PIN family toxin of toxin-antitoxin system